MKIELTQEQVDTNTEQIIFHVLSSTISETELKNVAQFYSKQFLTITQ